MECVSLKSPTPPRAAASSRDPADGDSTIITADNEVYDLPDYTLY